MQVEELTYFYGAHFAHICAFNERNRLARIEAACRRALARNVR